MSKSAPAPPASPITEAAAALTAAIEIALPNATEVRHHLHRHPELSHHEVNTARLVAERLTALGLDEVRPDVGGHGVVATLRGTRDGDPTRLFALRADMDALPIQETGDLPYQSCVPGVMHACGHDGHTATLLGTAQVLALMRDQFAGGVRFLFQPAEETVHGAERMCQQGAMEGVGAIVALHGWPGLDIGQIGVRTGPMMASSDTFEITIRGRGAHAAMPHISVDPIVAGAHIVTALQTLSSREISPVEPVVVTVAQFHAGTAFNIIPGEAQLKGTVRCLSPELRKEIAARVERIVSGVCDALRAEYDFGYRYGTPVTVNDASMTQLIAETGRDALGADNVIALESPSMGAEDFAVYLDYAPGAMFRLGVGRDVTPLHTPTYNFGDAPLGVGMTLFSRLALHWLNV